MQRRKIASVDQDTGEVLEGVIVYCGVKQNPYGKGWIMTSQDALELLAADDDLTKEAFRSFGSLHFYDTILRASWQQQVKEANL
jgi:hypothetical protein